MKAIIIFIARGYTKVIDLIIYLKRISSIIVCINRMHVGAREVKSIDNVSSVYYCERCNIRFVNLISVQESINSRTKKRTYIVLAKKVKKILITQT